jgi:hypothetical protein
MFRHISISLPFEGVPASLGPGLRTASGERRGFFEFTITDYHLLSFLGKPANLHEDACRSANDAWRTVTHLDGRSEQDPDQRSCLPMNQDPRSASEISSMLVRAAAERAAPGLRAGGKTRKIGEILTADSHDFIMPGEHRRSSKS